MLPAFCSIHTDMTQDELVSLLRSACLSGGSVNPPLRHLSTFGGLDFRAVITVRSNQGCVRQWAGDPPVSFVPVSMRISDNPYLLYRQKKKIQQLSGRSLLFQCNSLIEHFNITFQRPKTGSRSIPVAAHQRCTSNQHN